jgi:signal transduction histidine kinase
MSVPRARPLAQPRLSLLLALLLVTLVLAGLVAGEAHEATVSHRVTAERALRDYASVAAWEFASDARERIGRRVDALLGAVTGSRAASPFEPPIAPETILRGAGSFACGGAAPTAFRLDLGDEELATAGGALPDDVAAGIRRRVADDARTRLSPETRFATVRATPADGARDLIVYGVRWAQHGAPMAAYGLLTCERALAGPAFAETIRQHALLPSSVTGGEPIDSLVDVRVQDGGGQSLFRSSRGESDSAYAGEATLDAFPDITVRATLRPLAAERLLVGRPLRSRLPLLVGLLALTSALAVIALLQLRRERELERLRADFTSSVSHELRTPLAQILLFGETLSLERARSADERRLAAETIVQEARRLMHMVDNLLHFSRSRGPRARMTLEPAELAPILASVAASFAPLAEACAMRLRTRLEPGVVASVDGGALRQIVLNLLDNAVKYGPPGQTVQLGMRTVGDQVRIYVADEGPGIPEEDRERIWSPYVRLRRDRNGARGGSGIGLAVVRELAEGMGGSARVLPSEAGACLAVELPIEGPGAGDSPPSATSRGMEDRPGAASAGSPVPSP